MIPEVRFVLYQGNPETKLVELFTDTGPDFIPVGDAVVLYAQRPGATGLAFTLTCTATLNRVEIPFTAPALAQTGHYNYSLYVEPADVELDRVLKLRGVVRNGTGIEIVPGQLPVAL